MIERLWDNYRRLAVPDNATPAQVRAVRHAFFAGAAGLWTTLLKVMEEGSEPTEQDLQLAAGVQDEVDAFGQEWDHSALGSGRMH